MTGTPGRAIGRTVVVLNLWANGASEQPAIVTRVWGDTDGDLVNVTAFPDFEPPKNIGSIPLYSDRYRAEEHAARTGGQVAFLPTGR